MQLGCQECSNSIEDKKSSNFINVIQQVGVAASSSSMIKSEPGFICDGAIEHIDPELLINTPQNMADVERIMSEVSSQRNIIGLVVDSFVHFAISLKNQIGFMSIGEIIFCTGLPWKGSVYWP